VKWKKSKEKNEVTRLKKRIKVKRDGIELGEKTKKQ
jgi:hypothetical protein